MRLIACLVIVLLATPALAEGPLSRGERAAAQALAGKQAGKPQSCINLGMLRSGGTILTPDQIIYKESSNRVYVNRPAGGCSQLREDRVTITRTPSSQLCRGDLLFVKDSSSPMEYGACALGDFIPYERIKPAK